jgi:hypothetical protein
MATETDKTPSPADAPGEPSDPFIPGPDSGLRNPPSAVERGLKEAADAMHGIDANPPENSSEKNAPKPGSDREELPGTGGALPE